MESWIRPIKRMGACEEALEWCQSYDSLVEAWQACEHGDWMLWLLGKLAGEPESESRRKLVLTACQCARLSLEYVSKGEGRPLKAIETAEKWARGEDGISLSDVRKAAGGAYAAVYAAAYAYAAYAYAAYAAAYAAYAAAAYAAAAAAYAAAAARQEVLRQCADIVRANHEVPALGNR